QKYLSLTSHAYGPAVVLATPSTFDGLSDDEKAAFTKAAAPAAAAMREYVENVQKSGREEVQKTGMQASKVDHAAFSKALEPVYPQYNKQFGKELVDSIRNAQ